MPEGFRTNIRVLPECLEIVKKTHPEENRGKIDRKGIILECIIKEKEYSDMS